ncbi:MAG: ABC transporter ATP-binding protein [Pseudomonadota bacterium]|nr:ABC transporter ATP-binding protein [Pseudomonadota bacterium]
MISVRGLSRRYGDFTAVDGVSFEIGQGEIVGLLGHNGAGKTTIMKMLTGYLEPSGGRIHIDGLTWPEHGPDIKARLGYLPESLPVYAELTVADYLQFTAAMRGLKPSGRGPAIRRAMMETDLTDKALQPIATLSRGYKQRVGVAQAILHRPKLLILDEPTNGLDPSQTQHMRELIKSLSAQATVILSTHIMQEVDAICDRALILRNGRLVVNERLEALRQSNQLRLCTDADSERVDALLAGCEGVQRLGTENTGSAYRHRLQVTGSETEIAAAEVAQRLIGGGQKLFELAREQRDLETVFREANAKEDLFHAA